MAKQFKCILVKFLQSFIIAKHKIFKFRSYKSAISKEGKKTGREKTALQEKGKLKKIEKEIREIKESDHKGKSRKNQAIKK